jgi:hypothetical protein
MWLSWSFRPSQRQEEQTNEPASLNYLDRTFPLVGARVAPVLRYGSPIPGLKRPCSRRCGDQAECNARDGLLGKHAVPGPLCRPVAHLLQQQCGLRLRGRGKRQSERGIRSYTQLLRAFSVKRVLYVRRDEQILGARGDATRDGLFLHGL